MLDDWVYARDCLTSAISGRISFTGYESAWSIPQLIFGSILAKVVGFSHLLLILRSIGMMSLVAVVVMIDTYLRYLNLALPARLMVCAAFVFNPVSYILSLSFMTDMPFLFLWLIACFCWDQALATNRRIWVFAATLASMIAMAERQFALLIPISVVLLLFHRWWFSTRSHAFDENSTIEANKLLRWCVLSVAVIMIFFVSLSAWMKLQGGYQVPLISEIHTFSFYFDATYKMGLLLVLSSFPLLIITNKPRLSPKRKRLSIVVSIASICLTLKYFVEGGFPLFGNLISEFGFLRTDEVLLGQRPPIFGPLMNKCIIALAGFGFVLFVQHLVPIICSWFRSTINLFKNGSLLTSLDDVGYRFGSVLAVSSVLYLLAIMIRGTYFDRYFIPVLPALWLILARADSMISPVRSLAAMVSITAFAALSVTLTHDYYRWNEARWVAAETLTEKGIQASSIHAGYEWNGWLVGKTPFPLSDLTKYDYVVAFSPNISGYVEIDSMPWKSIWPPHDRKLSVLKRIGS